MSQHTRDEIVSYLITVAIVVGIAYIGFRVAFPR